MKEEQNQKTDAAENRRDLVPEITAEIGIRLTLDPEGVIRLEIERKSGGERVGEVVEFPVDRVQIVEFPTEPEKIKKFRREHVETFELIRAATDLEAVFDRNFPNLIAELFGALYWKISLLELDQETSEKMEKRNQILGEITNRFRDLFKEILMPFSRPPVMVNEIESKTEAGAMIQRQYRATSKGLIPLTASEQERARIDFEERVLKLMRVLVRNRSGVTMLNIAQKMRVSPETIKVRCKRYGYSWSELKKQMLKKLGSK